MKMESLAAFRPHKEGRLEWWWIGRNFFRDHPESRGIHQKLMAPSIRTLNAANDASILAHLSQSESGQKMAPEIWNP